MGGYIRLFRTFKWLGLSGEGQLRHGEPAISHRGFLGHSDPGLTDRGLAQLITSSRHLKVQQVYSSPLLRCQQFATQFANSQNVSLKITHEIQEIDFGRWEGKTQSQIALEFPTEYNKWLNDSPDASPTGGESLRAFTTRVRVFTQRLQTEHAGQKILIVTHGGVLRAVLKELSGISYPMARQIQLSHGVLVEYSLLPGEHPFLLNIKNPEVEE